MITVAICDDKQDMRELILRKTDEILSHSPYVTLSFETIAVSSAAELYSWAGEQTIDILLLDIELPGEDGLQIAEQFCRSYPKTAIIFVSSHENYVFSSLRFRPFRFVRKNKIDEELPEAILSLLRHIEEDRSTIMINTGRAHEVVSVSDILYLEKEKRGNYVAYRTKDTVLRERINISQRERLLCENGFCKVNSGTLVNLRHVLRADARSVNMSDGAILAVAAKYSSHLTECLIRYFRQKEGTK